MAFAKVKPIRNTANSHTILPGITVDGTQAGGMDAEELEEILEARVDTAKQAQITLKGYDAEHEIRVTAAELGLIWKNTGIAKDAASFGHGSNIIARYKEQKDLENGGKNYALRLGVDEKRARALLEENAALFAQKATDGSLRRENGEFVYVDGQSGYALNVDASVRRIEEALGEEWDRGDTEIALVIDEDAARGSREELMALTDVLGTFTTSYTTSSNARSANIANGCKLTSGEVVYPGETFSVLQHLVPFTEENGYYLAGSYLGNKVVDSLGGGICQVSTTLYNAVIRAELEVVERNNHSMIVGYVQPSMDAAIAESTQLDFKFRNTLDHPVYIDGYTKDKTITFNIYGVETRPKGREVAFESETLETIPSQGVEVETDATQPIGYVAVANGHTGYKAQLWKVVRENGQETSRELFNKSKYNMSPAIVTVGTGGRMTPEFSAAIATRDIETIRAAAQTAAAMQAPLDMLTEAAAEAAQETYSEAIAQGISQDEAMAMAQEAANQVVSEAAQKSRAQEAAAAQAAETPVQQEPAPEQVPAVPVQEVPAQAAPGPGEDPGEQTPAVQP